MCIAIYKPAGKRIPLEYLEESFKYNPDGSGFAWAEDGEVTIVRGMFTYEDFLKEWKDHDQLISHNALIHFRIATHGSIDKENCHPFPLKEGALIHNGVFSGLGSQKTSHRSWWEERDRVRRKKKVKRLVKESSRKKGEGMALTKTAVTKAACVELFAFTYGVTKDFAEDFVESEVIEGKKVNKVPYEVYSDTMKDCRDVLSAEEHSEEEPTAGPVHEMSDTADFVDRYLKDMTEEEIHKHQKLISRAIGYGGKVVILGKSGQALIFNQSEGTVEDGVWYSNKSYRPARLYNTPVVNPTGETTVPFQPAGRHSNAQGGGYAETMFGMDWMNGHCANEGCD